MRHAAIFLAVLTLLFVQPATSQLSTGLTVVYKSPPASDFTLPSLGGDAITLSALRGKVVLVNFWATWCPPCLEEFPAMQEVWRQLGAEGLEVLALNLGEDAETINRFLERFPTRITFPILLMEQDTVMREWGVKGLPATFVVDKQGRVIYEAVGGRDFASEHIASKLQQLLREPLPVVDNTAGRRGFEPGRVAHGKTVFAANCQTCHGMDAVGTELWQIRDSAGHLPPPPLNGSAHTWHHDRETLRNIIANGTENIGGTMPAWGQTLSATDIDSVIDWIVSLWPDEQYRLWREQIERSGSN